MGTHLDLNISSFCLHHGQGEESDESHEGNGCYEGHEGHEEEKGHEGYESNGCHEGNESHEEVKIEGFAKKGTQLLQEGQAALVSDHIEQKNRQKTVASELAYLRL